MIQLMHEIVKTFPNLMSMLVCCYGNFHMSCAVCRYGVGVSQDHMITKLLEYVPMLLQWVEQFMSHTPQPGKGEIEFRRLL